MLAYVKADERGKATLILLVRITTAMIADDKRWRQRSSIARIAGPRRIASKTLLRASAEQEQQ